MMKKKILIFQIMLFTLITIPSATFKSLEGRARNSGGNKYNNSTASQNNDNIQNNDIGTNINSGNKISSIIDHQKKIDEIRNDKVKVIVNNDSNDMDGNSRLSYGYTITYNDFHNNSGNQTTQYVDGNIKFGNRNKYGENTSIYYLGEDDKGADKNSDGEYVSLSELFNIKVQLNGGYQPNTKVTLDSKYKQLIEYQTYMSPHSPGSIYYSIEAKGILTCPQVSLVEHWTDKDTGKEKSAEIGRFGVYNFVAINGGWAIPLASTLAPLALMWTLTAMFGAFTSLRYYASGAANEYNFANLGNPASIRGVGRRIRGVWNILLPRRFANDNILDNMRIVENNIEDGVQDVDAGIHMLGGQNTSSISRQNLGNNSKATADTSKSIKQTFLDSNKTITNSTNTLIDETLGSTKTLTQESTVKPKKNIISDESDDNDSEDEIYDSESEEEISQSVGFPDDWLLGSSRSIKHFAKIYGESDEKLTRTEIIGKRLKKTPDLPKNDINTKTERMVFIDYDEKGDIETNPPIEENDSKVYITTIQNDDDDEVVYVRYADERVNVNNSISNPDPPILYTIYNPDEVDMKSSVVNDDFYHVHSNLNVSGRKVFYGDKFRELLPIYEEISDGKLNELERNKMIRLQSALFSDSKFVDVIPFAFGNRGTNPIDSSAFPSIDAYNDALSKFKNDQSVLASTEVIPDDEWRVKNNEMMFRITRRMPLYWDFHDGLASDNEINFVIGNQGSLNWSGIIDYDKGEFYIQDANTRLEDYILMNKRLKEALNYYRGKLAEIKEKYKDYNSIMNARSDYENDYGETKLKNMELERIRLHEWIEIINQMAEDFYSQVNPVLIKYHQGFELDKAKLISREEFVPKIKSKQDQGHHLFQSHRISTRHDTIPDLTAKSFSSSLGRVRGLEESNSTITGSLLSNTEDAAKEIENISIIEIIPRNDIMRKLTELGIGENITDGERYALGLEHIGDINIEVNLLQLSDFKNNDNLYFLRLDPSKYKNLCIEEIDNLFDKFEAIESDVSIFVKSYLYTLLDILDKRNDIYIQIMKSIRERRDVIMQIEEYQKNNSTIDLANDEQIIGYNGKLNAINFNIERLKNQLDLIRNESTDIKNIINKQINRFQGIYDSCLNELEEIKLKIIQNHQIGGSDNYDSSLLSTNGFHNVINHIDELKYLVSYMACENYKTLFTMYVEVNKSFIHHISDDNTEIYAKFDDINELNQYYKYANQLFLYTKQYQSNSFSWNSKLLIELPGCTQNTMKIIFLHKLKLFLSKNQIVPMSDGEIAESVDNVKAIISNNDRVLFIKRMDIFTANTITRLEDNIKYLESELLRFQDIRTKGRNALESVPEDDVIEGNNNLYDSLCNILEEIKNRKDDIEKFINKQTIDSYIIFDINNDSITNESLLEKFDEEFIKSQEEYDRLNEDIEKVHQAFLQNLTEIDEAKKNIDIKIQELSDFDKKNFLFDSIRKYETNEITQQRKIILEEIKGLYAIYNEAVAKNKEYVNQINYLEKLAKDNKEKNIIVFIKHFRTRMKNENLILDKGWKILENIKNKFEGGIYNLDKKFKPTTALPKPGAKGVKITTNRDYCKEEILKIKKIISTNLLNISEITNERDSELVKKISRINQVANSHRYDELELTDLLHDKNPEPLKIIRNLEERAHQLYDEHKFVMLSANQYQKLSNEYNAIEIRKVAKNFDFTQCLNRYIMAFDETNTHLHNIVEYNEYLSNLWNDVVESYIVYKNLFEESEILYRKLLDFNNINIDSINQFFNYLDEFFINTITNIPNNLKYWEEIVGSDDIKIISDYLNEYKQRIVNNLQIIMHDRQYIQNELEKLDFEELNPTIEQNKDINYGDKQFHENLLKNAIEHENVDNINNLINENFGDNSDYALFNEQMDKIQDFCTLCDEYLAIKGQIMSRIRKLEDQYLVDDDDNIVISDRDKELFLIVNNLFLELNEKTIILKNQFNLIKDFQSDNDISVNNIVEKKRIIINKIREEIQLTTKEYDDLLISLNEVQNINTIKLKYRINYLQKNIALIEEEINIITSKNVHDNLLDFNNFLINDFTNTQEIEDIVQKLERILATKEFNKKKYLAFSGSSLDNDFNKDVFENKGLKWTDFDDDWASTVKYVTKMCPDFNQYVPFIYSIDDVSEVDSQPLIWFDRGNRPVDSNGFASMEEYIRALDAKVELSRDQVLRILFRKSFHYNKKYNFISIPEERYINSLTEDEIALIFEKAHNNNSFKFDWKFSMNLFIDKVNKEIEVNKSYIFDLSAIMKQQLYTPSLEQIYISFQKPVHICIENIIKGDKMLIQLLNGSKDFDKLTLNGLKWVNFYGKYCLKVEYEKLFLGAFGEADFYDNEDYAGNYYSGSVFFDSPLNKNPDGSQIEPWYVHRFKNDFERSSDEELKLFGSRFNVKRDSQVSKHTLYYGDRKYQPIDSNGFKTMRLYQEELLKNINNDTDEITLNDEQISYIFARLGTRIDLKDCYISKYEYKLLITKLLNKRNIQLIKTQILPGLNKQMPHMISCMERMRFFWKPIGFVEKEGSSIKYQLQLDNYIVNTIINNDYKSLIFVLDEEDTNDAEKMIEHFRFSAFSARKYLDILEALRLIDDDEIKNQVDTIIKAIGY